MIAKRYFFIMCCQSFGKRSKKFIVILIFTFVYLKVAKEILKLCTRSHLKAATDFKLEHCNCTRSSVQTDPHPISFSITNENTNEKGDIRIYVY